MQFQLIDTDARDEDSEYIIHLFGRTLDGRSVNAKVVGFKPYLFIKLHSNAEHSIVDDILKFSDSIVVERVNRIEYYGFTNKRLQVYLKCSVDSIAEKNELQNIIKNADGYIDTYEAKMLPYLRFFHERNIEPSGWITCKKFKENPEKSYCDESIIIHCNNVEKFVPVETVNAPFKISSFDIECIPGDNFSFPDPVKKDDPIIQIGTTTNILGQSDKIIKHIITLNTCDPIDGVTVVSVKTEKELLQVWCEYIRQIDPDIITGYNTFGFDYNYIAKRCSIYKFYLNLSRLNEFKVTYPNNCTNIIKKTLSSAAYGKNDMYYIKSPGRIPIDLFKVVQKDYKFESYKLDNVAGEFICGKITGVKCGKSSTQISVNTTADVDTGNFISIKIDKLREYSVNDTVKFVVERVGNNKLIIAGVHPELLELIQTRGLTWALKKDDISIKDIFSFQKIDSHHRSLVAKYCFVEGTRVSLQNSSVDIRCLENMETDVVSWEENKGFSTSKKIHFFNNGFHECIKLTMIDGTTISCTKEHKILTINGWVEAQYLQKEDAILFYPEPAYCDYTTEQSFSFKFSDNIGYLNYEKSCILSRILGYVLTDGVFYNTSCYKNYSKGRIQYDYTIGKVFMGTLVDAKNIQAEIFKLVAKLPAIRKCNNTYDICLPTVLVKMLLSIDGVEVGRRIDMNNGLPRIITDTSCPLWIVREFLKGLMGGDGHSPCLSADKFTGVAFSQSRTEANIDSLTNYITTLKLLFSKFDIESTINSVTKNTTGIGFSQKISIKQSDLISFYGKIGYSYCASKSYRLAVAASYYKMTEQLKQSMTVNEEILQVHNESKSSTPLYNTHYSLPGKYMIKNKPMFINALHKFETIHFPSATAYTKHTGSYELFTSPGTSKSHAVKSDSEFTPCYFLNIISKESIGSQPVYDIEVENTHNFVANGAVVHNCIMDNVLCNKLMEKIQYITSCISMSNVCFVPISFLIFRGQDIKAYSIIAKKCLDLGYIIRDIDNSTNVNTEKYQGAIVLEAKVGGHFYPVVCNDFASLYPSTIISHNLSPDCLIEEQNSVDIDNHYIAVSDTSGHTFSTPEKKWDGPEATRPGRGVIPQVLIDLLANRKKVKKMMAGAPTDYLKNIYNCLQTAYKLTANSIYGSMGSNFGSISCKPVAESTTAAARGLLQLAIKKTKELYPTCEIIYGDSVLPSTCVVLRDKITGQIYIKEIQELSKDWESYENFKIFDSNRRFKQQSKSNFQILSETEFVDIIRVIRHKTIKKIYRISTSTSSVEVTEDHSLFSENGNLIKPSECSIGTKLLINTSIFEKLNPTMINYQTKELHDKFTSFLSVRDKNNNEITSIELLDEHYTDFVYDIETSNGRFCGGVGNIVLKNTDSIFVKYLDVPNDATPEQKIDILSKSMDCGRFVEETVGKFLPWPHKLEFEKLYFPYLLYSKKRYSGVMYENDPTKYSKVDNKGIILTRRDNAKIVKYIFQGALEYILFKSDPKGAYDFITETITKMCNGEFGEDMFIISKAYKLTATETHNNTVLGLGSGILKTEQPQMSLIRKRKARGDTSIQYNDRINFMFVKISKAIEKELLMKSGRKTLTQGDRVEDPEYIKAHPEIQIDYSHYISNQITNPLIDLMAIFEEGTEKQREKIVEEYFQTFINEEIRKETGVRKISDYFTKKE